MAAISNCVALTAKSPSITEFRDLSSFEWLRKKSTMNAYNNCTRKLRSSQCHVNWTHSLHRICRSIGNRQNYIQYRYLSIFFPHVCWCTIFSWNNAEQKKKYLKTKIETLKSRTHISALKLSTHLSHQLAQVHKPSGWRSTIERIRALRLIRIIKFGGKVKYINNAQHICAETGRQTSSESKRANQEVLFNLSWREKKG